jgi:hypothetical protein
MAVSNHLRTTFISFFKLTVTFNNMALTPQQLQQASGMMSSASQSGSVPPPSYSGQPGGMTGQTLDDYVTGNNSGGSTTPAAQPAGPTMGDRVGEAKTQIGQIASGLGHIFSVGGHNVENAISSGSQRFAADSQPDVVNPKTGMQGESAMGEVKSIGDLLGTGLQTAGAVAGTAGNLIGTPIAAAIKGAADKLSNFKGLQDFASSPEVGGIVDGINSGAATVGQVASHIAANHPQLAANLGAVGNIAGLFGEGSAAEGATGAAVKGTEAATDAAGKVAGAVGDTVGGAASKVAGGVAGTIGKAGQGAADVLSNIPGKLSEGNIEPNLGSSIDRLAQMPQTEAGSTPQGIGMKPIGNDPMAAYNKYYDQEQAFKGDAKQDTALGLVGSEVGNAYNKVIGMRKNAGALMGSEMDRVGNIPTDISHTFQPLEQELTKNGLSYDADSGKLDSTRTSKVTDQDKGMLQDYIGRLNQLGPTPTAGELDAFLSKTPQELDVFKQKNNVTKVTNGERIINGHLSQIGQELTGAKNPEFAPFEGAKKDYASLSNFLDTGAKFLGKKTASGDYEKDASLAKSSIQSALNGGKKDWLNQLESLTGFPAIDHSMLAIQAMKDAGNFRGSSLLDLLSPQAKEKIPLTKEGIIGKVVDGTVNFGKEKLVGTPTQQTRRIIQDHMDNLPAADPEATDETTPA